MKDDSIDVETLTSKDAGTFTITSDRAGGDTGPGLALGGGGWVAVLHGED